MQAGSAGEAEQHIEQQTASAQAPATQLALSAAVAAVCTSAQVQPEDQPSTSIHPVIGMNNDGEHTAVAQGLSQVQPQLHDTAQADQQQQDASWQSQQPHQLLAIGSPARSTELTDHLGGEPTNADSLLLVQHADPAPSVTAVTAWGVVSTDAQEVLTDLVGDLDALKGVQDPTKLHAIIQKLFDKFAESHEMCNKLRGALSTLLLGCKASMSTLQEEMKTVNASFLDSSQLQDDQSVENKYDKWTLSAFKVSGPPMRLYSGGPPGDVQIWLLVLTGPEASGTSGQPASNAADIVADPPTVHLFVPEDALNLLGMSDSNPAV